MDAKNVKKVYWNNTKLINQLEEIVTLIRKHNFRNAVSNVEKMMQNLMESASFIVENIVFLQNSGLSWGEAYFVQTLGDLENAQKSKDYILLADLYELLLLPALYEVQSVCQRLDIDYCPKEWFENNCKVLEKTNPVLYKKIVERNKTLEHCRVEFTSCGAYTLAFENNQGYYFHSNKNPIMEAEAFANRFYKLEKEKYLVVGLGLGYHVKKLFAKYPDMELVVVENDLNIILAAMMFNDLTDVLGNVSILYDEDFSKMGAYLNPEWQIAIFRPMLAGITDEGVKQRLSDLADRLDSGEEFQNLFYQNARMNFRKCDGYVDEISDRIKDKRVVVVAGGPSLDKNIDQLKNKPEDAVIIAVGTVFKLLLEKKIEIDYVVFIDCEAAFQIEGVEDMDVPIIVLSTADRGIAMNYQGKKYLACQRGYEVAAAYAGENGFTCYESGGSVTMLALDIAIRMCAKSIAIIGLDLAYDGKKFHATGTAQELYDGNSTCDVEGIDGTILKTNKIFLNFKKWFEKRITQTDAKMLIVDATEGGAKIQGFKVMKLAEYLSL